MPKFLNRYLDYIISHETGHQWWYNVIGNNKFKEIWLDEGINVYWLSKYIEDKYGPDAKLLEIGAGTTEIRKLIIARDLLKNKQR